MNLVRCDVCGKILKPNDSVGKISYDGNFEVIFKNGDDFDGFYSVERDVCRKCTIDIMRVLRPRLTFLNDDEYDELRKHG